MIGFPLRVASNQIWRGPVSLFSWGWAVFLLTLPLGYCWKLIPTFFYFYKSLKRTDSLRCNWKSFQSSKATKRSMFGKQSLNCLIPPIQDTHGQCVMKTRTRPSNSTRDCVEGTELRYDLVDRLREESECMNHTIWTCARFRRSITEALSNISTKDRPSRLDEDRLRQVLCMYLERGFCFQAAEGWSKCKDAKICCGPHVSQSALTSDIKSLDTYVCTWRFVSSMSFGMREQGPRTRKINAPCPAQPIHYDHLFSEVWARVCVSVKN